MVNIDYDKFRSFSRLYMSYFGIELARHIWLWLWLCMEEPTYFLFYSSMTMTRWQHSVIGFIINSGCQNNGSSDQWQCHRQQESKPRPRLSRLRSSVTVVIFLDITSAILPLTSEYSFYLVWVRDLGLGLGLGLG